LRNKGVVSPYTGAGRKPWGYSQLSGIMRRRALLKAGAAVGLLPLARTFIQTAHAAETVKIELDNPLTGTFAALGKNGLIGAQLAVEQMNAKGGIDGRQVELLVEDQTSGEPRPQCKRR